MAERVIRSLDTGNTMSQTQLYNHYTKNNPAAPWRSADDVLGDYLNRQDPNGKPIYEEVGGSQPPAPAVATSFEKDKAYPGNFAENFMNSAAKFAKEDIGGMVQSLIPAPPSSAAGAAIGASLPGSAIARTPLAQSMWTLAKGTVQKLIPGQQGDEKTIDAVFNFYKERYGSPEKFAATAYQDPVGFASDLAAVVDIGGMGLKAAGKLPRLTKAAEIAGDVLNPLVAPTKGLALPVRADITGKGSLARRTGEWLYESALGKSGISGINDPRHFLEEIERVKQAGLKHRIPVSPEGRTRLQGIIDNQNSQISGIVQRADAAGYIIDPMEVVSYLQDLLKRHAKSLDSDATKAIQDAANEFLSKHVDVGGAPQPIRFADAYEIKKQANRDLAKAYESERPRAYLRAQVELNRGLLDQMVQKLQGGPVTDLQPMGKRMRDLGQEQKTLIHLENAIEDAMAAEKGRGIASTGYAAAVAGRAMAGHVTPGSFAVGVRTLLDWADRKSKLALSMTAPYSKAQKRAIANIGASATRGLKQYAREEEPPSPRTIRIPSPEEIAPYGLPED